MQTDSKTESGFGCCRKWCFFPKQHFLRQLYDGMVRFKHETLTFSAETQTIFLFVKVAKDKAICHYPLDLIALRGKMCTVLSEIPLDAV